MAANVSMQTVALWLTLRPLLPTTTVCKAHVLGSPVFPEREVGKAMRPAVVPYLHIMCACCRCCATRCAADCPSRSSTTASTRWTRPHARTSRCSLPPLHSEQCVLLHGQHASDLHLISRWERTKIAYNMADVHTAPGCQATKSNTK